MIKRYILAVMMFLMSLAFVTTYVYAVGDAPVPAPTDVSVIPEQWVKVISAFANAIGAGFMVLVGWVITITLRKADSDATHTAAIDALEHGVEATELTLVRKLNESSSDGKYTKEEIDQLHKSAIDEAMRLAKGPALDLMKSWGTDYLKTLVSRIVAKKKATVVVPAK